MENINTTTSSVIDIILLCYSCEHWCLILRTVPDNACPCCVSNKIVKLSREFFTLVTDTACGDTHIHKCYDVLYLERGTHTKSQVNIWSTLSHILWTQCLLWLYFSTTKLVGSAYKNGQTSTHPRGVPSAPCSPCLFSTPSELLRGFSCTSLSCTQSIPS